MKAEKSEAKLRQLNVLTDSWLNISQIKKRTEKLLNRVHFSWNQVGSFHRHLIG